MKAKKQDQKKYFIKKRSIRIYKTFKCTKHCIRNNEYIFEFDIKFKNNDHN